jgi:hypothetical protein
MDCVFISPSPFYNVRARHHNRDFDLSLDNGIPTGKRLIDRLISA